MDVLFGSWTDESALRVKEFYEREADRPLYMLYTYICWLKDDKIVAVALYEGYQKGSIELHLIVKCPLTRGMISLIARYPFEQLGVNVVFIKFARHDKDILKVVGKNRFKYLATVPEFFGSGRQNDALFFTINKEQSLKWRQHGRRNTPGSAIC